MLPTKIILIFFGTPQRSKMSLIPIAIGGALSEAAGTIFERKVLRTKKIKYQTYNVFSFLAIVILIIPVILITDYFQGTLGKNFMNISSQAFQLNNILIMLTIIVVAIFANLLIFYAMKWEKITELEPIRLMQPLFAILLALMFYASERQTKTSILIAGIIASIALIFSHLKKHHLQFNKYSISAILGSLFFAVELVLSKKILPFYTPLSFYLIRCFFIFLVCYLIFRPKIKEMPKQIWIYTFITAGIWVTYRFLLYSSYIQDGIIFTTILFIISPIFIYLLAYIFLKEKLNWKNIIAAIIIVCSVVYAIYCS